MNYSDGLQWEFDSSKAGKAKCKVFQLASGKWLGRIVWQEDGYNRVMQTEPCASDWDAMSATEKLLAELKLEIEGEPVVDTKEAQATRMPDVPIEENPLWQPDGSHRWRPILETIGGVAELIRTDEDEWYGAVGVEGYVFTTKTSYESIPYARMATEQLMAEHGVTFATHDPNDAATQPKLTRFTTLTEASHALKRGIIKHGNAESSLGRIANLWNAYIKQRPFPEEALTASEVSEMLTLFKIARNQTRPNTDNYVDGIGYLALAAECMEVSDD